jgi:putative inorganic carbon (hco3(-)) transporter
MIGRLKLQTLYAVIGIYLIAVVFSLLNDFLYIFLLPVVLGVLYCAFYHLEYLLLFAVAATPLSLNLEEQEIAGVGLYLPTEPLLAGAMVLMFFKMLSNRSIDKRIFFHPISYLIYGYLAWMALTCITSEYPIVSLKFLITRMWFISTMYFLMTHIFQNPQRIWNFVLCYMFSLTVVILYTVIRHAEYGFDKESAHWVMEPLFKDHTSYGAVLAMFTPMMLALLFWRNLNLLLRVVLSILMIILIVGLVLSFTRAAWVSVVGAGAILVILLLQVRLRTLLITAGLSCSLVFFAWDDVQVALKGNKQESSDKLDEHVSSISNVSSDASNLERLNRWNCALEMFYERPVFGWGPGTYQFVYAPFQRSGDRTIISTNQGDGGNAHSEYLGPLCEQGVAGILMFIALLYMISDMAFRLFYSLQHYHNKLLVAGAYLGLMTYFIHGTLNNYLDTDKASVPFWGFLAILVSIDLYHRPHESEVKYKPPVFF